MSTHQRRSRTEVLAILEDLKSSGLSRKAFAESRGISLSTICLWLRREGQTQSRRGSKSNRQAVLPVRIVPGELVSREFSVTFPNGTRVSVPEKFDSHSLERLIEVVAR